MLKKKLEKAINDQVNFEIYSSYLYLAMSSWFTSKNLMGFANWMRVQAQEELIHAMKFFNYVNERGGRAILSQIKGPENEWKSPLAAFEDAYKHEIVVSSRICNIADIALEEKDHMTHNMIQWFVNEQVEEESNAKGVVDKLKLIKDNPGGLFMLDAELGQRVFNSALLAVAGLGGPGAGTAAP